MTSFVARTTRVLRKNLGNGSKLPQGVGPYTWTLVGPADAAGLTGWVPLAIRSS